MMKKIRGFHVYFKILIKVYKHLEEFILKPHNEFRRDCSCIRLNGLNKKGREHNAGSGEAHGPNVPSY
jgi:hypothetical protein